MKSLGIIQARMGSSRLPGKVVKLVEGRSILEHTVSRVQAAGVLDQVIVATTSKTADDAILDECNRIGVPAFRGSEDDVLSRYYHAAVAYSAEVVVRVTSDCPLYDPEVLRLMMSDMQRWHAAGVTLDYYSNTVERSFPRGLDTEIFTMEALDRSFRNADKAYEKEHVTPYIYTHPDEFVIRQHVNPTNHSDLRWTLDTEDDFRLIQTIYAELRHLGPMFGMEKILELLAQKPEISAINSHVKQKVLGN